MNTQVMNVGRDVEAYPVRVLLVEDNATNAMVAQAHLKRLGCEITWVEDGQEAIEQYTPGRYDVVLMDLQMPRVDGFEASAHIRSVIGDQDVPIIAVSAARASLVADKARESGMNGFEEKPVDWPHLWELILAFVPARQVG